jgi:flagellar hook-basal body complex protein FliE
MNPISGIGMIGAEQLSTALPSAMDPAEAGASFKDFLIDSIKQMESMQHEADLAVENLFTGGNTDPAEVLTAVQKADLAFRLMMQARNKLVQFYQEIQNIQI